MADSGDPVALGQLLRSRRERLVPADVGLPEGSRRRAVGLRRLIERLNPFPAYLQGQRWDVLAANAAARELFTDWDALPAGERNLVRWMFTAARAREVYLDWEPEARAMLGRFRLAAARHTRDEDFEALIAGLRQDSPHVRDWWPRHDVTAVGGAGTKKLLHPRLGPIEYSHVVLLVADNPDQTLVTFSPAVLNTWITSPPPSTTSRHGRRGTGCMWRPGTT